MSKVSVILAVYNDELNIINAIQSVINQTYKNWELIIIDDCSTDNSFNLIDEFIKSNGYSNIYLLVNEKNCGTYVSANIGIQKATGDYIIRLDSDDKYDSTIMEKEVKILDNNHNIVACQSYFIRENYNCRIGEITLMFRKNLIETIGYYDSVRIGADTEFICRIKKIFGIKKIFLIKEILYYAKLRENSLTTSPETGIKSNIRIGYEKSYKAWHNSRKKLYIDFPLTSRLFEADKIILP